MPTRRRPPVSVCVPAYNGAAWLRQCLESARRQTFRDFELLVVDDASDDQTPAIAREVRRAEPRLRLVRNPRRLGLVGNWNRCVALARGAWVKFLFQDDTLEPDCLGRMLAAAGPRDLLVAARRRARFEPGVPAAVRRHYRRHMAEHSIPRRFPGRERVTAAEFAASLVLNPGQNCIGEPTAVLLRRRAFGLYGGFDPELVMLCDWELCARVAANAGLRWVDATLATFRVHQGAESAANRAGRRYRAEVLDDLLIRRALAVSPAYAPVRRAAAGWRPPLDLTAALAAAARDARALARRYAGDARRPDAGAPAAWGWARRRYPRLAALAARPVPGPRPAPRRVRRAALDLLAGANA